MPNYPVSFPLVEAKRIYDLLKSGKVSENKQEFAHKAWVVQGYLQSTLIGAPPMEVTTQSELSAEQHLAMLKDAIGAYENGVPSAQALPNINWRALAIYILKQLLEYAL